MRSFLAMTFMLFLACPVFAGSDSLHAHIALPLPDKGIDDPIPQGDFEVLVIPLKRVQNLYMVEAKVDSVVGNFILDTGAPHLVLNKTYFNTGKSAPGSTQYGITGGGNSVMNTTIDTLKVSELFYTRVDADIVNLGHLENARGVKILGLLGTSLFSRIEMEIDMKNDLLYLYKTDEKGERLIPNNHTSSPDMQMPLDIVNDVLFIEGRIANKKLRFCLDTGAERNVLSNTVSNKIISRFTLTKSSNLAGSGNSGQVVLNGVIDSVVTEGVSFTDMPFILTNLSYLELVYGTTVNGVLGYDYLSKGYAVINMQKKLFSMYFYKPEEDDEP